MSRGLSKKGSYYYLRTSDVIIAIGLQKSNFSNTYYINVGYVITQLSQSLLDPKDVDGEVRTRFNFEEKGKRLDTFDLENFSEDSPNELTQILDHNIEVYIIPVSSLSALKSLIEQNPTMLYQTKLSAKKLLGFE